MNVVVNDNVPPGAFNLRLADSLSSLLRPLSSSGDVPPVHHLVAGNPAIDSGNPLLAGTLDQLGNVRSHARHRCRGGNRCQSHGTFYLDRNGNGLFDSDEIPLPQLDVRLSRNIDIPEARRSLRLRRQTTQSRLPMKLGNSGLIDFLRDSLPCSSADSWMVIIHR